MALMYPREVGEHTGSAAERKLFDLLRHQLSDEWLVLHSVGLLTHPKKPWAEIDYILVGPPGVFCLEVKGGRVSQRDGRWFFQNRYGHESSKREGPFAQVGSAAAALTHWLIPQVPAVGNSIVGFGVLMPDIEFDVVAVDVEPQILFDLRDLSQPFDAYIQRLHGYWRRRLRDQKGHDPSPLQDADRQAVLGKLRPDFDLRPSLRTRVGMVNDELLQLTTQQYQVLDGLADNERVLVRGGAGSGKTLLAVEEARRCAGRGERVFWCCFNRNLAEFVRESMSDMPTVEVQSFHAFLAWLVADAGRQSEIPDVESADRFAVFYPLLADEILRRGCRHSAAFDVLVVDEVQDLLQQPFLDVFDGLLRGGLARGEWRMFFDAKQDAYRRSNPEALDALIATGSAQFRLTVNCRNSAPVAVMTALLSGIACDETRVVDGPETRHYWYENPAGELRLVAEHLKNLVYSGIKPSEITLLSKYRIESSCLAGVTRDFPWPIVDVGERTAADVDSIHFSTVNAFKGLESDVVFLLDTDDLASPDALTSIYIGGSRARSLLSVFLSKGLEADYERSAKEYGERLAMTLSKVGS